MSAAPDYIDPLVAWRAWLVVDDEDGARLRSVVFPALWPPGRDLAAECKQRPRQVLRPWRRSEGHRAPSSACDCGIYGASRTASAAEYVGRTPLGGRAAQTVIGYAIGRVRLWGSVVEHKLGWRASHAYPGDLYVPAGPGAEHIALGLAAYGVPVEILDCSVRGDLLDALTKAATKRVKGGFAR